MSCSRELTAQAGVDLRRYAQEDGRVIIPTTISGTLQQPQISLDILAAARRALGNEPTPPQVVRRGSVQEEEMTPAVWLAFVLAIAGIVLAIRLRAARRSDRELTALLHQRTAQLTEALDRVEQLATTDPLTGIANRRRFAEFLQREWKRALRSHTPITLVMVDVDLQTLQRQPRPPGGR